jgi:hypothetical protein
VPWGQSPLIIDHKSKIHSSQANITTKYDVTSAGYLSRMLGYPAPDFLAAVEIVANARASGGFEQKA